MVNPADRSQSSQSGGQVVDGYGEWLALRSSPRLSFEASEARSRKPERDGRSEVGLMGMVDG